MAIRLSTGTRQALQGGVPLKRSTVVKTDTTIAAVDGGEGNDSLTDSDEGFLDAGFSVGDSILVEGFTGGAAGLHGPFTILTVDAGTIEVATGSLADDDAGESVTITLLIGGSLRNIFKDGILDLYTGPPPANADAAETGTKLTSITVASGAFTANTPANGLEFGAPSGGIISKDASTWSGVGLATGEVGYYRFYDNAYVTGASTTARRIDGVCAESGGDLTFSDLTVTAAATKEVTDFSITLPAY
jgi:hypothetical protein